MKNNMRLLFVGDENVGKSTLISTIYSQLSTTVEKTHRRVILPPQMCLYSKQIFTQLIDTSSQTDFKLQIQQADLILLIYDISDPQTIERIESVWLNKISSIKHKVPVILVGNKIDIKEHQYESQYEYKKVKDILRKVTRHFKNVQMGIECSAFYDRNVKSVLNCAQRAVLYPLSPLYDLEHKKISLNFEKALIRIFRILDKDLDGKIHDLQMNNLQERVFQSQLNIEDLKAIKQIIIRELKVDYHDYIELSGFLALQKKCIDMLKIQICWSILRYFNYNDHLRIIVKNDNFQLSDQESIQLSFDTIDFLLRLYHLVKKQNSHNPGQLQGESMIEQNKKSLLDCIFSSSPWIRFPQFQEATQIEEQKFLLTWQLYAFIDYEKCYQDLLYLGYEKQIDETFVKTNRKKTLRSYQKLKQNKIFSVLIIEYPQYEEYLSPLFQDGQKVAMSNGNFYSRNSCLYKNKDFSKVFLLFKVHPRDLQVFMNQDEETKQFSKKMDLLISFNEKHEYNHIIPESILHRHIDSSEAEEKLNASMPLSLNLESFPVQYYHSEHHKLFEIIYESIIQFSKYLSNNEIDKLKKEQEKNNKFLAISSGIAFGLLAIGTIAVKNGNGLAALKFWGR